jgi:hypothetical protein
MITNDQISLTKRFGTWNLVVGIYLIIDAWSLKSVCNLAPVILNLFSSLSASVAFSAATV